MENVLEGEEYCTELKVTFWEQPDPLPGTGWTALDTASLRLCLLLLCVSFILLSLLAGFLCLSQAPNI